MALRELKRQKKIPISSAPQFVIESGQKSYSQGEINRAYWAWMKFQGFEKGQRSLPRDASQQTSPQEGRPTQMSSAPREITGASASTIWKGVAAPKTWANLFASDVPQASESRAETVGKTEQEEQDEPQDSDEPHADGPKIWASLLSPDSATVDTGAASENDNRPEDIETATTKEQASWSKEKLVLRPRNTKVKPLDWLPNDQ